ncbi:hypothetical protein IDR50_000438 [Campylobacter lari]|nr:hypothetical protein [Campylobacter lari]
MKIIAPYRFVNLHEKVFYPKDEEISFDVPYKDEQSGVIDIKIIAKSPIFVGDKKSEDDKEVKFFKIDEKFCIPSSSIRGVVRTLAEVLSFAKLKTQDLRLSYNKSKKLFYKKSTLDLLKQTQINYDDDKLDMVERIFGYVKKDEALKSRVNFSNFYTHNAKELQPIPLILSSPRPTFYPYYILQDNDTCFTYDDANAKLSGFKFYVPKNNMYQKNNKENPKIDTKIQALDKGAVFEGKMRYFNLTPQELGLLLLTLSVFDSQEYYYKIGGAKAFGYGDCHIQINFDNEKLNTLISQYKQLLQENGFDIQKQIEKLKSIAKKMPNDIELKYLELKDFANIKKQMREKCKNKSSQKNFNHKPKKSYDKYSTQSKDEPNNPFGNLKQLLF